MSTDNSVSVPTCADPVQCLFAVVQQTRAFIAGLTSDDVFVAQGGWNGSSIGGHVRHCWDHVAALVDGFASNVVDYDSRKRGTAIEHDRTIAIRAADEHLAGLRAGLDLPLAQPVQVCAMLAPELAAHSLPSTVGREVAFVLSHTIHHQAIMATIAVALDQSIPDGFGFAPSTTAFLRSAALAKAGRACAVHTTHEVGTSCAR